MKLIVGLGNPGKEYEKTRHSMGFMALDAFADVMQVDIDKESFHGIYGRLRLEDEDWLLLKPLTFMNLSGQSVREIADYFKINVNDIVVIYDEMALPPGKIRLREKGSSGGHKGMQSIIDHFKNDQIKRIRIGIGEPTYNVVDYVLGKPSPEDQKEIDQAIQKTVEALKMIVRQDFKHAMSKYN